MIHIQRTYPAPATLISAKAAEAQDEFEKQVQAGQVELTFDANLYSADDVKQTLVKMQHGKCCFCESQITHVAYGDVEHFRPKKAVREDNGQLRRPGYYWLAYTWENLLLACEICNRREKRNKFPIEGKRARRPGDALDEEQATFIDPAGPDDPETHITFTSLGRAVAIDGNRRGKVTIEELNLNRDDLAERRQEQLLYLKALWELKQLAEGSPNETALAFAEQGLKQCVCADAEYAGLARSFLRRNNIFKEDA
jgi:uncharacterized protein (TIGR02646 family)